MDLRQKLEVQEVIDSYISDHDLYDLFQGFASDLMLDKPSDPFSYLIKKLSKSDHRRMFLTGASGRVRREISKELSSRFHIEIISVGELLKSEVEKNTRIGKKILAAWKEGSYVSDPTVLETVMPVLERLENERTSYILEGMPRTRGQAIALQRAGLVPDRLIKLTISEHLYRTDFIEAFSQYASSEASYEGLSGRAFQEYELGMKDVLEEYTYQCHQVEAEEDIANVAEMVYKAFVVKGRAGVTRKAPRVLVIGGPLSGKSTQTRKIAEIYGLVLVRIGELVDRAVLRGDDLGELVAGYVKARQSVPEKILIELLKERLEETDCKSNGWVLDGFPVTFEQCRALKYLKLVPSNVYFLEGNDNLVYERAKHRKIDPKTGVVYGKETEEREELVRVAGDDEDTVRSRLLAWREDTIKIHAEFSKIGKSMKAEIAENLILSSICESLEMSIPSEIA